MLPSGSGGAYQGGAYQLPNTISAIEQMVRTVLPDFELTSDGNRQSQLPVIPTSAAGEPASGAQEESTLYPSMPFGFDMGGRAPGDVPQATMPQEHVDFTAADMGWDIDFGTMDMEAFLSIDSNQAWGFRT